MSDDPKDEKDDMTPQQREAIQKAWTILTEWFERVLLVVDYDVDEANGKQAQCHEGYWHGGALSAVGMCEYGKDRILGSGTSSKSKEPEDDDD